MTIQELIDKIESLGDTMDFCIEDVFSWRGVYSEPACTISTNNTTKEHNLSMLNKLITETFYGWKGGEYTYQTTFRHSFNPDINTVGLCLLCKNDVKDDFLNLLYSKKIELESKLETI